MGRPSGARTHPRFSWRSSPILPGTPPGTLSLYARGRDYHAVIRETLTPFAERLAAETGCKAAVLTDDSPLPEVRAARLAGVGAIGENGLLFDPDYGSWVFIGTILTDLPFSPFRRCTAARAPHAAAVPFGGHSPLQPLRRMPPRMPAWRAG